MGHLWMPPELGFLGPDDGLYNYYWTYTKGKVSESTGESAGTGKKF